MTLLVTAFVLAVALFAMTQSAKEAAMIRVNLALGITEDLDHKPLVIKRRAVLGTISYASATLYQLSDLLSWKYPLVIIVFAIAAWSGFNVLHRLNINRIREFSPWYLAAGNQFDRKLIEVFYGAPISVALHRSFYQRSPYYTECVHRAGKVITAITALIFVAAAATLYLWA